MPGIAEVYRSERGHKMTALAGKAGSAPTRRTVTTDFCCGVMERVDRRSYW
jgi:hypothetical protein